MININLDITNPFCDRFDTFYYKEGRLTKNKSWEIQGISDDTILRFSFRLTFRRDHAGVELDFGLLGHMVTCNIHDNRHWNHDENRWYRYDENPFPDYDDTEDTHS